MTRNHSDWIKMCVNLLFVVTLIQILYIGGLNAQKIDSSSGLIIHNAKEPPDLQTNFNSQQTFQNLQNSGRKAPRLNQRPMNFLCTRRIPAFMSRRNIPAQTTESPFTITVKPEVSENNRLLHVKLNSKDDQTFRGFMIQVLSSGTEADDMVLGEFIPTPNVNLQNCYSNGDTVTSADRTKMASTMIMWKAPPGLKEKVIVRATVVQDYRKYWLDIKSEEITFDNTNISSTDTAANETGDNIKIPNNLDDENAKDLKQSIAETFEDFDGPFESADEVLLHQGIREVDKVDGNTNKTLNQYDEPGVIISPPKFDEAPTAPLPPPRYIYRTMNQFAPNFEPPTTSEFVAQLLKGMLGGSNRQPVPAAAAGGSSGGGLGSMMNMMGMASQMFGGSGGGGGGGGGGLMSSLGTISKLSGMLGGGNRGSSGGGLGGLGALSSMLGGGGGGGGNPLGAMLGGALGGGNAAAPPPRSTGGGLGGLGALSSLLGGLGKRNNNAPPQGNVAPVPQGAPVNPTQNNEPSLADLLGVDPTLAIDNTPTVVPAEANPLGGISAAKAGGGLLSKVGGFAPVLAMAPIALKMFGGNKKKQQQQQQMPFGMPGGMPGGPPGQFGMPGGRPGQFGMPPGQQGQFGIPPGQQGQFGRPPGQGGQFGMPPGQGGQFGGAPDPFGRPPQQGMGPFGPTQQPSWATTRSPASSTDKEIQQIIQLLEAQRLQIELLKNQIGGSSITSQMGGFGNIPLSLGQSTSAQLLGLSGQGGSSGLGGLGSLGNGLGGSGLGGLGSLGNGLGGSGLGGSGLGGLGSLGNGLGSTLSTFEPAGPPKIEQKPQSSSNNDLLLQQLLQQNQMLMQQNQQFQNNMLAATRGQGQFGAQSGSSFNRVNRSNGPTVNSVNPGAMFNQNMGQSNFPQAQNNGLVNGLLPGGTSIGGFPNTGQTGQGAFGTGAANGFNNMPNQGANTFNSGSMGGQGMQNPSAGAGSILGQFGGSNQGTAAAGGSSPNAGFGNAGGTQPQGGAGGGGSLTSMFGGGAGSSGGGASPSGGGMMAGSQGGNGAASGQSNPLANLMGGGAGGGGAGGGGPDLGSLMGNMLGGGGGNGGGGMDLGSLMGNMLGGGGNGGGGGMDISSMLGNVDMNAMSGLLSGDQGKDLMKSVSGMLSGPQGGDLMNAVNGMMSGNGNPADIMGLMGSMDPNELQSMAKQAEGIMASSGIDPAQILSMMGKK